MDGILIRRRDLALALAGACVAAWAAWRFVAPMTWPQLFAIVAATDIALVAAAVVVCVLPWDWEIERFATWEVPPDAHRLPPARLSIVPTAAGAGCKDLWTQMHPAPHQASQPALGRYLTGLAAQWTPIPGLSDHPHVLPFQRPERRPPAPETQRLARVA